MKNRIHCGAKVFAIFLFFVPFIGTQLFGQENVSNIDSTIAKTDSAKIETPPVQYEEFILETIRIEAVVEKPSVTLIPKRAQTDVGNVPLNIRSFDKELKTKPESLSSYGEDLETGKKIKNIGKSPKK